MVYITVCCGSNDSCQAQWHTAQHKPPQPPTCPRALLALLQPAAPAALVLTEVAVINHKAVTLLLLALATLVVTIVNVVLQGAGGGRVSDRQVESSRQ